MCELYSVILRPILQQKNASPSKFLVNVVKIKCQHFILPKNITLLLLDVAMLQLREVEKSWERNCSLDRWIIVKKIDIGIFSVKIQYLSGRTWHEHLSISFKRNKKICGKDCCVYSSSAVKGTFSGTIHFILQPLFSELIPTRCSSTQIKHTRRPQQV